MRTEKCKNCTYYSAYYKQFSSGYGKLNKGFCSKNAKQQTHFETCENFKSNEQKEERQSERRLLLLDQAIISINEIAQILKEKENENKRLS